MSTLVLDGGMSNALEDLGHELSGRLWTAQLLRDAPEAVAEVHREYYLAGADVATTASYQASVDGFVGEGMAVREAADLVRRSVLIARRVRDELAGDGRERLVAASVGPYGAVLADGSEYRGDYGLSRRRLRDFHRPRLELLLEAGPDILAVETIPDIREAEALADLLAELGAPAWFSFSVDGTRTRAGQPVREAVELAASIEPVLAVGVNCCRPEDVLPCLRLAGEVTDRPLVAYPNSGETWDPTARGWAGGSRFDVTPARSWVEAGASYVGGCCRVGPRDIAALAASLRGPGA